MSPEQDSLFDLLEVRFAIRLENLDSRDRAIVNSRIEQLPLLGIRVREVSMPEQTPTECIYMESYWYEERLLCREFQRIQSEYVEKRSLVSV